jgi:hypothetical protein
MPQANWNDCRSGPGLPYSALSPTHAKVITLLAGVRHDFAHGNIDELDAERTKVLRKEFRAAAPENMKEQFESDDPVVILSNGFILAWAAIDIASHAALAQREKERRALKFQTDLKSLLEKHETS